MSPMLRRQGGLTLIELLLSLAIAALLLVPLLGMVQSTTRASEAAASRLGLEREAEFALAHMAARIASTPVPSSWSELDQKMKDGALTTKFGKVEFFLDASGNVIETEDGPRRTLAEAVQTLSISASRSGTGQPLVALRLSLARGDAATTATTLVRMGSAQ